MRTVVLSPSPTDAIKRYVKAHTLFMSTKSTMVTSLPYRGSQARLTRQTRPSSMLRCWGEWRRTVGWIFRQWRARRNRQSTRRRELKDALYVAVRE